MLAEVCPSAFDDSLLTAITWMANGIRERDLARKYLSFFIALEALFIRDNKATRAADGYQNPIVPIGEGVGWLLGGSGDARRQIAEQIEWLGRTRNKIVHRGFTMIDEADLIQLGSYLWNSCWQAATKRASFRVEDSFQDWLRDQKP